MLNPEENVRRAPLQQGEITSFTLKEDAVEDSSIALHNNEQNSNNFQLEKILFKAPQKSETKSLTYQASSFEEYISTKPKPPSASRRHALNDLQNSGFTIGQKSTGAIFTRGRVAAFSLALLVALAAVFLFRDSISTGLSKMIEVSIFLIMASLHITLALKHRKNLRIKKSALPAGLMARRMHPAGNLLRALVFVISLIVFGGAAVFLKIALEGSVAYDSGQYAVAADRLSTLINVLNIGSYHQQRGNCYFRNGEYQKAIKDYTEALKSPTVGLYFARAHSYEKLGERNHAASDFKKGIELAKELGYESAAKSLLESDQFEDALKMYNTMIKESPKSAKLYAFRGNCFNLMERYEDAVKDYTTAISHYHDFGQAYYGRGLAYDNLNKEELAEDDYAQAKKLGYEAH